MPSAHDHAAAAGHAHEVPPRLRRLLIVAVAPFVVATVVGLVLLWPAHAPRASDFLGPPADLINGTVVDREEAPCLGASDESSARCATIVVRLQSGEDAGELITLETSEGPGAPRLRIGQPVVVGRSTAPGQPASYYFADYQRRTPLAVLAGVFALVVVVLGRWRGVAALAALAVSLLVVIRFVLPALLAGSNPLAVAVVGAAAIMFVALYLTHGVNAQTTTAVLGTLASLALTAVLGAAFVAAARFTGLASEEAGFLQAAAGQVNLRGLLLGGIVIGSLGVLDDVTVTQASAVWQLHAANPAAPASRVYRAALQIGRDHVASTVNTLVLAYAGASLPILILFSLSGQSLGNVVTGELIAEEVVRTLVGSIGLVASVPITTALAVLVVTRHREPVGVGDGDGASAGDDPALFEPWLQPPPELLAGHEGDDPGRRRRRGLRRRRAKADAESVPPPSDWRTPRAEREFWGDEG